MDIHNERPGAPTPEALAPPMATRHRVLIVSPAADDDRQARSDETIAVVTATSGRAGREAIAACQSRAFDALVIDWLLPDNGGRDLLEELRRAEYPAALVARRIAGG